MYLMQELPAGMLKKHQSISKAMVILRLSYYNIINKCNIVISFTFEGCEWKQTYFQQGTCSFSDVHLA